MALDLFLVYIHVCVYVSFFLPFRYWFLELLLGVLVHCLVYSVGIVIGSGSALFGVQCWNCYWEW
jgi:hypothetical protein